MAQITSIVSEALQAKIRSLLPSQSGFTEDLQAQNVIVPIVDLTETASGSSLRMDLQTALDSSCSPFTVIDSTADIATVGGFYRVIGNSTDPINAGATGSSRFAINDGSTSTKIWRYGTQASGSGGITAVSFDFIAFLRSGDTLQAISGDAGVELTGSVRQIADLTGNLVNPTGFTIE